MSLLSAHIVRPLTRGSMADAAILMALGAVSGAIALQRIRRTHDVSAVASRVSWILLIVSITLCASLQLMREWPLDGTWLFNAVWRAFFASSAVVGLLGFYVQVDLHRARARESSFAEAVSAEAFEPTRIPPGSPVDYVGRALAMIAFALFALSILWLHSLAPTPGDWRPAWF